MSKKNKGHNAYFYFMLDWQEKYKKGKSLREVSQDPLCNQGWQSLSTEQRKYYEAKAKEFKAQGNMVKKTALGESLQEVEEQERKLEEFKENMIQYIESILHMGILHNKLGKLKFIFIHVNWFYKRDIGINKAEYCPAEFAVAEFSIQNGIENIYHEILNMKTRLGMKKDAIETSQATHQIPLELAEGEKDFNLMYNRLVKFLENNMTGNKFPPLFTNATSIEPVQSLLRMMTKAGDGSVDDFQVYSLETLFGKLRNAAAEQAAEQEDECCTIPIVIAEAEFSKDEFNFTRGIECNYHKLLDNTSQYCSKAIVRRWGFTICDHCCSFLQIEMVEGVHCPIKYSDHYDRETDDLNSQIKFMSISEHRMVDMNGVTDVYRQKRSQRTYAQEQSRRHEDITKPLTIVDHSKLKQTAHTVCNIPSTSTTDITTNIPSRPLRLPNTRPQALEGCESTFLNETNFPPIGGRGIVNMRKPKEIRLPLGRGHGGGKV